MFRGDPIRRPPKQCATINHQTICHPPEQSGCLDDHEPKHAQPFGSLVFSWNEVSICFHGRFDYLVCYDVCGKSK